MMTRSTDLTTFEVENFEGPLHFLLHLVQKCEITLSEVTLHRITHQFLERLAALTIPDVEVGGEFLGTTASLIWLKSKLLLPRQEEEWEEGEPIDEDPFLTLIPELIEYCRFKQLAQDFQEREEAQTGAYVRGNEPLPSAPAPPIPLAPNSAKQLLEIFQDVLKRSSSRHGVIHEEEWKVGDKISLLRRTLKEKRSFSVHTFFTADRSQGELVVTFLAMLELMKIGELHVNTNEQGELWLVRRDIHSIAIV